MGTKAKKKTETGGRNGAIKRYPFIPGATDCGDIARRLWRSYSLRVKQGKHSTKFICRLHFRIPKRMKRKSRSVFAMLFETQTVDIEKELGRAYEEAAYKGNPVTHVIEGALRAVLTKALANIFLKAQQSSDPYAEYLTGTLKEFMKAARPRRVPNTKLREKRAIRLARNYDEILPTAGEILTFVKQYERKNDHDKLRIDLKTKFPKPWITHVTRGKALQNLPQIVGYDAPHTLDNLNCTPRQLAVGIVWSIEDERGEKPSLSATTILEDHIPLGRKLLGKGRSPKRS